MKTKYFDSRIKFRETDVSEFRKDDNIWFSIDELPNHLSGPFLFVNETTLRNSSGVNFGLEIYKKTHLRFWIIAREQFYE